MIKIVEHETTDGDSLEVIEARRIIPADFGVLRMIRKRNECLKPSGFILKFPQFEEVVNTVFIRFNMTVEHGCIRPETNRMRDFHDFKPARTRYLLGADLIANPVGEDLRAAARHNLQTRVTKSRQYLTHAESADARKIVNLNGGKSLDAQLRVAFADRGDEGEVEFKRPVGVQTADDMHLGKGGPRSG